MSGRKSCSIVDAGIKDLSSALANGKITAVDLVLKYLFRISTYDCRDTSLNSIPLLNPNIFDEAASSDDRRQDKESTGRSLEGIPFTVKDSYKVKGMTVASGSEAFENLIANEDAFTIESLRAAGAILIGKTNMCPMAYGGMLRGVYGRAESPYNLNYLPAAFASGSSNGSGVSTAASFAAFGMGEETVSSGRSPASNNGLIAYTPSRGLISIRGNWPLYPTCDTVVPHTRTMDDLFEVLDAVTAGDCNTVGDFWRDQPFLDIPKSWEDRPCQFSSIKDPSFLQRKRIAVPEMYLGKSQHVYTSDSVISLWEKTAIALEACGATVVKVQDFPVVRFYENPSSEWPTGIDKDAILPPDWNITERGTLIAHGWDDFLRINGDKQLPTLEAAQWSKIFPQMPTDDPQVKFSEVANAVHWSKLATYVKDNATCREAGQSKIFGISHLKEALEALENMRKTLFEDWLTANKYDFVAFPAAGDVGFAEADVDMDLARHTWKNGVKYSHGNRAFRHLGIPSITVPMGMLLDKSMPIGLTILGKAYDDLAILKVGYAFEQTRQGRVPPPLTPPLKSDSLDDEPVDLSLQRPSLKVNKCTASRSLGGEVLISIEGTVEFRQDVSTVPKVDIYIDAAKLPDNVLQLHQIGGSNVFEFATTCRTLSPPVRDSRNHVIGRIARDSTMVIVLARNGKGRPSGHLKLLHGNDVLA